MKSYLKYIFAALFIIGAVFALLLKLEAFSPEAFAALASAILALAFEWFPWLANDYDQLPSDAKQKVMLGLVFFVVLGSYLLSCIELIAAFACTYTGAMNALVAFFLAIGINQGVHRLFRKREPVPIDDQRVG